MKRRSIRRWVAGTGVALACAGLVVATTACDAEYYGGYSAADGQYWRSKGICSTMVGYGASVQVNYCWYPLGPPPDAAVQYCMKLAVAAFPSQGMDSWPAASWLAGLCGGGGSVAYYVF